MDFSLDLSLIFLLTVLLLSFLLLHRRGTSPLLPPGSLGLPLLGETLRLVAAYKSEDPEPFVDERLRRYGTVFTTHIFGEATVFSADPETNRFVLQNEGKLFECSYPGSIANLLGKHSLLLMKGALHKRMHSLTTSFANSSILKERLLSDIDRLIRLNMDSWNDKILLMEEAKKITFELTMKQLMSVEPGEWTESIRKEYVRVIEGFFTLPIPIFSSTYRRTIRARTKVAEELGEVVRERRKGVDARNDMLGSLLSTAAGDDGRGLSDDEVVDFMVALLVAGYETTSTIMTLAVKFLTETPLALSQLTQEHEEIRARRDWKHGLEWSDYKSMSFTQCVINETLRVANIIAGVFRRTTADVNIKGYTIPKGWKVFASFRAVHLDPLHFEDARAFDPWRWKRDPVTTTTTTQANVFMPFGGGPRLCPGYELARVIISVFLHHFVTRFSWVPAEDDKLIFFPTTRMLKRYPINVTPRDAAREAVKGDEW